MTGGEGGGKAAFLENSWLRRVCYSVVFKCFALTSSGFGFFLWVLPYFYGDVLYD